MTFNIAKLDKSGLRKFGVTTGALVSLLFGGVLPWMFEYDFPVWPWIIFSILSTIALSVPLALQPVYNLWMKFGLILNWINTRLILGLLFFGIFTPIGLLFKFTGRDSMHRDFDDKLASYRSVPEKESRENMEHPY